MTSYTLIEKQEIPEAEQHKFRIEDFEQAAFVALQDSTSSDVKQCHDENGPTSKVMVGSAKVDLTAFVSKYGQWLWDAGIIK